MVSSRPPAWPALALAAWSIVVWAGRLRNLATDDGLTLARTAPALGFIVGGLVVALAALRRTSWLPTAVVALAGWTIVVWVVRGTGILIADHDAGFTAVHTTLAVVSIGLAVLALSSTARSPTDRRRVRASGNGSRPRP